MNPFVLGAAQNISEKLRNMDLNDLNVDLNLYQFYNRFRVADRTFHAYHYGKKLKSALYYAYLIEFNVIVKILFIAHNQRQILCICRLYKNVSFIVIWILLMFLSKSSMFFQKYLLIYC